MRSVFSSLRRVAPFLFSERGAVSLTRALNSAGSAGPGTLGPDTNRGIAAENANLQDLEMTGGLIADGALDGARLSRVTFDDGTVRRSHLRRASLQDWKARESTWDVVDLEGGRLQQIQAPGSRWTLVSLRDAELDDVDLTGAGMTGCDLTRSRLRNVRATGADLCGADLSDAVLTDVDLTDADVGGSVFRGAWFARVNFDGAIVKGADFRDVAGIDETTLASLRDRGALTGGGHVRKLWTRLLGGTDPAAAQPRIRAAVGTSWTLLALLVPALFFGRAILFPVPPEEPPAAPLPALESEAAPEP